MGKGFSLCFLLLSASAWGSVGPMLDRLVFKINDSAYTQREMECHLLVKAIQTGDRNLIAGQTNWAAALENFKDDMLMFEETQKLRYALNTNEDFSKPMQEIRTKIADDEEWSLLSRRLVLTDLLLETILQHMSRIAHQRPAEGPSIEDFGVLPSLRIPPLEKRNFIRFYGDAGVYHYIQPNILKSN